MLFNSHLFIFVYLPIVLAGFFSLASMQLTRAARGWLLLSSLFFYAYWDIRFLPLLIASILFNYGCGFKIVSSKNGERKKLFLILGIVADLSLLFYFKYYNFFMHSVLNISSNVSETILPLGISFFTFTQIAYLVDTYQNKAEPCDLLSYGLFVTVFPHLIAGPILHHKEMIQQFESPSLYKVSWSNFSQGIFLFVLGLFKKVIIADTISGPIQPIFSGALPHVPFIQAWFGALGYTLQLYFDFSGYSDMAVGLGLLFNLHLPINFNSPYQADCIIDFWRRWHITLSTFLRDYLYIPLGGSRHGEAAKLRNLMMTMLLGGLWHGAGWTFILWGACHGTFLVINHLWRRLSISLPQWLCHSLTLLAVICAWVIFRAPTVDIAVDILKGMAGLNGIILPESYAVRLAFLKAYGVLFAHLSEMTFRLSDVGMVVLFSLCALLLPNSNDWQQKFKQKPMRWAIPCACLFIVILLELDSIAEFLYYQF